jgi:outer membrane protein
MKRLALLLLPGLLLGSDLKDLLDLASKNSDLVKSKQYTQDAKNKSVESQKSNYYPTLDIGAFYQRFDEKSPFMPGVTSSAYAKVAVNLYDGGMNSALVKQKESEQRASSFDTEATKKNLSLSIVQDYYSIKDLEATLSAQAEAEKFLKAQLYRVQQFFIAKMATKDQVDRLKSAFDTNHYQMEVTKLQIFSTKKSLELKIGKSVEVLDEAQFVEPVELVIEQSDAVKSLSAQKESLAYSARAIMSADYPSIRVEDMYSQYKYENLNPAMPQQPDKQNQLMVTLNMRIFDNGTVQKNKEAILANAQALNSQIEYLTKEQKINFEIAKGQINADKAQIESSGSALEAAKSAFKTIEEKYNAGIADNVTYLDALSSLTNAKALHVKALNDLQGAYGAYYFYSGKDIKEFLK